MPSNEFRVHGNPLLSVMMNIIINIISPPFVKEEVFLESRYWTLLRCFCPLIHHREEPAGCGCCSGLTRVYSLFEKDKQ